MKERSVSEEEIRTTEEYLKGYLTCEAFLRMNEYEACFFEQAVGAERRAGVEVSMARMKQFEIRHFILGMGNSREKLLLYYHYIRGDSVEQCAELMEISRSSGFRLKRRALIMATLQRCRTKDERIPAYEFCEEEEF